MGLELPTSCVTAMRISSSVTRRSQAKVRCNHLEFPARSLTGKTSTTPVFKNSVSPLKSGGREGIRTSALLVANSGENKLRQGATIT